MARNSQTPIIIDVKTKKRFYETIIYPEIPVSEDDIYITSQINDRLDLLALRFYQRVDYWIIIANANSLGHGSLMVPGGLQLRIPALAYNFDAYLEKINTV